MKISLITITFNNFSELAQTIQSVPKFDFIEQVVVNGGNCPETGALLAAHPEIISISEKDQGIADAFNKGLKLSRGEALMFLNSGDILVDPDYLLTAKKTFEVNPNISFIHANILFTDPVYGELKFSPHGKNIGFGMPFYHQTMVTRREVFDQCGAFDLSFKIAMDYEHVCRMKKKNLTGEYIDRIVIKMDGGGISRIKEKQSIEESYLALKKNGLLSDKKTLWRFRERQLRYKLRILMEKMKLKPFVRYIKRKKQKFLI